MFTGIIRQQGVITTKDVDSDSVILVIQADMADSLAEGDSVAVNGVCLTVLENDTATWTARLMKETLDKTTLGNISMGDVVNLELPLTVGDTLDGHFVQGHVDGVGEVKDISTSGEDRIFTISMPDHLLSYMAPKGSIALDGVSLTIVDVLEGAITVSIMPYTLEHTTFGELKKGDGVNIECDMIAKQVLALYKRQQQLTIDN